MAMAGARPPDASDDLDPRASGRKTTPTRQAMINPPRGAAGDRPSDVPLPPEPGHPAAEMGARPVPSAPDRQQDQRAFTEDDARAALRAVSIEMYATTWCGSCRQAREYLDSNGIAYREYDIEQDESASSRLAMINPSKSVPTFQIDDMVQIGFAPESMERNLNEAARKRLLR